jgi:hypothetical protein
LRFEGIVKNVRDLIIDTVIAVRDEISANIDVFPDIGLQLAVPRKKRLGLLANKPVTCIALDLLKSQLASLEHTLSAQGGGLISVRNDSRD